MGSASTCTFRHASCALILLFCLALVDGRCPASPHDLPIATPSMPSVLMCARIYDGGDINPTRSCHGAYRDIPNKEHHRGARRDWWNDRISSVVVRPACQLRVTWDAAQRGSSLVLDAGVHHTLPGWDNQISSWFCNCKLTTAVLTCTPSDSWRTLKTCFRGDNIISMKCEYWIQKGLKIGNSFVEGGSISTTIGASGEVAVSEAVKVGLQASSTTSYNWESEWSNENTEIETHKVSCDVARGQRMEIRQIVGKCDDTLLYTGHYECKDSSSSATTDTITVAVTSSPTTSARISELGQILINDGWRTKTAVMGMTEDDCRNTIIHILTNWGSDYSVQDLQRMRNEELVQRYTTFKRMRDALVEGGYRTESQLRNMSEDDCRNTLIVVVFHSRQQQISIQDLQRKTNNELIEMLEA